MFQSAFSVALGQVRTTTPDREGLFTIIENMVVHAQKASDIPKLDILSLQVAFLSRVKAFCNSVEVLEQDGEFAVIPGVRDISTYQQLKFGSRWFSLDGDAIDPIIVAKIFWGCR